MDLWQIIRIQINLSAFDLISLTLFNLLFDIVGSIEIVIGDKIQLRRVSFTWVEVAVTNYFSF